MLNASVIRRAVLGAILLALLSIPVIGRQLEGSTSHPAPTPSTTVLKTETFGLAPCSPSPCASYDGLLLHVSRVEPDYRPVGVDLDPRDGIGNGFHVVRLALTLTAEKKVTIASGSMAFHVRDALGQWHSFDDWDAGDWIGITATGKQQCQTEVVPNTPLAPGATVGPLSLCFKAAGAAVSPTALAVTDSYVGAESLCGVTVRLPAAGDGRPTGQRVLDTEDTCWMLLIKL
jgi:hypothetical protein